MSLPERVVLQSPLNVEVVLRSEAATRRQFVTEVCFGLRLQTYQAIQLKLSSPLGLIYR